LKALVTKLSFSKFFIITTIYFCLRKSIKKTAASSETAVKYDVKED
jgi:hypothetical protein